MIDRFVIAKFLAVSLGIALVVGTLGNAEAARRTSKSSRVKISVRAAGPERSLAGIRIGRPATQVLARYGNPTRVDVGAFTPDMTGGAAVPGAALPSPTSFGLPANPSSFGAAPGSSPADLAGQLSGLLGVSATPPGPGFGAPASPLGGPPPETAAMIPQRPVTKLFYDYPDGQSLIFTVGYKGRVEQIDAFSAFTWSPARTLRGINVGSTYKQVVAKYGYPANQRTNSDGTLVMNYSEQAHCSFTLLNLKVIGVSVALVE